MSDFELVKDETLTNEVLKTSKGKNVLKKVLGIIEPIIISFLLAIFSWLFLATPHEVFGQSMEPNVHDKSFVVAAKLAYKFGDPQRGDVIIFKRTETRDYIKRVIGLPGEKIRIEDCKIYINDSPLDESAYLANSVCTLGGSYLETSTDQQRYEIIVPENKYFVVGDNRNGSTDSRDFGPQDISLFKGKAVIVFSGGVKKQVFTISRPKYNI
ncbi:MAG TPA: signal peptidase I [Candidatus Dojkabacteria bacterium]|nr:signal peptidase I [Candidatus Dojkabacteria bacterium]HQF37023.1 signal peptidase I [Candidatus Dojkabacteria bacterium]